MTKKQKKELSEKYAEQIDWLQRRGLNVFESPAFKQGRLTQNNFPKWFSEVKYYIQKMHPDVYGVGNPSEEDSPF